MIFVSYPPTNPPMVLRRRRANHNFRTSIQTIRKRKSRKRYIATSRTTNQSAYPQHLTAAQILVLSQIEANAAIISASAPALRPLISKTFVSSSHGQSEPHQRTYGSGGPTSRMFSRGGRSGNGQLELYSFGGHKRTSKVTVRDKRNTSEESILGVDGITKTVETTIAEHYGKEPGEAQYGDTHGYEGLRRSNVGHV
jgi:hypothetical protein